MLTKPTTNDVTFFNTLSLESDKPNQLIQLYTFICVGEILLPSSQALHSIDGPTHHHHLQKDTMSVKGVVEVYLRGASATDAVPDAQTWCSVQCTMSVENLEGVPPKLH
ncbi:hypothetical protein CROQUDRAFT_657456 [Cronartium quercuum f. sp. fusiforme G11]|uniref:Uncharacterized protein n=1 Tax=Cronartium quercuum f. sp. fusiforme G11 TaxID=708437 RepID=A0A9P6NMY7_9BASI|nr:hypothetical protein CROQUDRAFT_657456 [Cronartium quercuum f. sp. fusiforme G11]